jgi:hypothetical protein
MGAGPDMKNSVASIAIIGTACRFPGGATSPGVRIRAEHELPR